MDAKTTKGRDKKAVLYSSVKHDWGTPDYIFDKYHALYNFTIDLAASAANTKLPYFYSKEDDALRCNWNNIRGWLNPPYGRTIIHWVKKAYESTNSIIVMLVPARVDTKWWGVFWDYALHRPKAGVEVHFMKGRLKFVGAKHTAPFPSAIVIFNSLLKE